MMDLSKKICRPNQQGQAATEFIIASVFLLVPLFLTIPILGKYIDIRHAAINQARFEAWEYTVWRIPGKDPRVKIKPEQSAGERKYKTTRKMAKNLFFSDPSATTYPAVQGTFQQNPLWVDHKGDSLFTSSEFIGGAIREHETPTTFGKHSPDILNFFLDGMGLVTGIIADILHFEGVSGKFDVLNKEYRKNYVTSNVTVSIRSLNDILPQYSLNGMKPIPDSSPLTIHAKASVLTDAWNSGSTNNTSTEARGLVVTAFLRPLSKAINPIIEGINSGLNYIPGISIKLPSMPDFAYVDDDIIPLEYLKKDSKKVKKQYQLDYYE